jgi:eukaryotic-like serine/threonine-protein kinase
MGTLRLSTDVDPNRSSLRRGVGFGVAGGAVAIGDVIANKYKVERLLGMGGMGCVVSARHEPLGHEVAIKVMVPELCKSDEAVARFLREARAAANLLGDHVVRVLDVDTMPGGAPFMVMELLEGHDLARELDAGPLPVRDTVDYVLQACEALAEAHALGIVHRDLKPANLFRARRADGSVVIKVVDFGVSNMVPTGAESSSAVRLTDTKSLLGSPSYMSPEQVRDPKTVDPRSDIWSLGVIVHELLTGTTPFGSDSPLAVLAGVVADDPPNIRSLRADVPPG